jgi:putative PIN family toxin of toxin-antitoxin system
VRAIVDTNVLISYLLNPGSSSPPSVIIRAALAGAFTLVTPQETLDEVRASVSAKPYLARHVSSDQVTEFIELVREGAIVTPPTPEPPAHVTRDPGDDFLLTQAVLEAADILVTGDKDLLVLGEVAGVRIITPASFVALLDRLAD